MSQTTTQARQRLAALLLGAFALRAALAVLTEGYAYDQGCFFAWADRMAQVGPAQFYAPDYFADYPPGGMLVLGLVGHLLRALHLMLPAKGAVLVMALPFILCDLALTVLVWHIGCRCLDERRALWLAGFAAFCPALLYDTTVWKQVDSALALCMMGAFWLLERQRFLPAALVYGIGLAFKPQALLFGPVLALCFLQPLLPGPAGRPTARQAGRALVQGLAGAAAALAPVWASAVPFVGVAAAPGFLLEKYFTTASSYAYASVNAFNLFGLLGANWAPQSQGPGLVSWQQLGTALMVLATLWLCWLVLRSSRAGRHSPLLLAALYGVAIVLVGHRMHERYLLPGLLVLLAASARWGDRRLLFCTAGLSLTGLLNQAVVMTSLADDPFLENAINQLLVRLVSGAQVALLAVLLWAGSRLLLAGTGLAFTLPAPQVIPPAPEPQPRWRRAEALALALLTAVTALVSFAGLGDRTAPQTVLDGRSQPVSGWVHTEAPAREVWVYSCISDQGSLTVQGPEGTEPAVLELGHTNTFSWRSLPIVPGQDYRLTLQSGSILEVVFLDEAGQTLPVTAEETLAPAFDEQALRPESISYRNSMYFDEIYHARTAYEQLHRLPIYETTHPPLGKVFQMVGIALFGMTGFGWRCAGAAFGVAMVPVLYLLVRRLTRRPGAALFAAALFALDGMRLAQSRIATIDVYGTFFILLSALLMVWYAQSVLEKGVCGCILPMALCGAAFGLGAASKWTGLYAGAGLAVLYFWVLWLRGRQRRPGYAREVRTALVGGVAFFVVLPLVLYIGSYFVYRWQDPGFGLSDWWACQTLMFRYHSGLVSTHSFESRWYSWPLMLRPVWYYAGYGVGTGMHGSISGIGSPLVWWASTAAVLWLLWRQASGQGSRAGSALTVLYLTQLLPWVLVTRCTFLYHYFPSLVFAVAALGLWLARLAEARGRRCACRAALLLAAGAAVLLVWFYPVLTGVPAAEGWFESLRWLPSWYF